MTTRFTDSGLELSDASVIPLYSGEFHYWRAERSQWRPALLALKELGLAVVSSVVPWSVHETGPGRFDFAGQKDLGHFLDEAHALDLRVMLRPGPNCNAQLSHFGFPERVLANPKVQAVSGRGTPLWLPVPPKMFPVPSYASTAFQDQVRGWFEGLAAVVAPRMHPKGPVVALQLDHEMQMFWRLAAFEGDYHPEALAWWEEFAGGLAAPRSYEEEDMPRLLKWQHFKEEYLRRSIAWIGEALDEVGLGALARYHNLPPGNPTHFHQPMIEATCGGPCGMDFYDLSSGYKRVRSRALYLAGSSLLPFAPELGVGGPPWFPAMSEADEENVALGALAGGLRAFNLYMAVERERWYGGAIDDRSQVTASGDWIAPLLRALRKVEFHRLRRQAPIALLVSRAETRAAIASSSVGSATHALTDWLDLGSEGHSALALDPDSRLHPQWLSAITSALDMAEVPYQLVDESSLHRIGPDTKAVVLPTLRRVDGAAWAALHALAQTGMRIVIGPELPREDELGRPLGEDAIRPPGAGLIDAAMLTDTSELAASLLDLAGELEDLWIAPESQGVDCSVYSDSAGKPRALFVGNASSSECQSRVNVFDGCVLSDAITNEELVESGGTALVSLAPYQVRFFVIH